MNQGLRESEPLQHAFGITAHTPCRGVFEAGQRQHFGGAFLQLSPRMPHRLP
jgi:hypothetical protein